jgi:hypothetical protein
MHSAHACGKALSTSTLVDAPATPPALGTCVRAGEREKDVDAGRSNSALSPLPYPYCGAGARPRPCTRLQPHPIPPRVLVRAVSESPRHQRGHTRWCAAPGKTVCKTQMGGHKCNVSLEQLFRELWTHLRPQFSQFWYSLPRVSVIFDARHDFVW